MRHPSTCKAHYYSFYTRWFQSAIASTHNLQHHIETIQYLTQYACRHDIDTTAIPQGNDLYVKIHHMLSEFYLAKDTIQSEYPIVTQIIL